MNKLLRLQNLLSSIIVSTTVASGFAAPHMFAEEEEATPNNAETTAPETAAPETAVEEETALERVVKHYDAVRKEVEAALYKADSYISLGRIDAALALLSEAESALPNNVASVPYRDRIALLRQRAIERKNGADNAEDMIEDARIRNRNNILAAEHLLEEAQEHLNRLRLPEATAALEKARAILPVLPSTVEEQAKVRMLRAQVSGAYYQEAVAKRSPKEAESYLTEVKNIIGEKDRFYIHLKTHFDAWRKTADAYNPYTLNPKLEREEHEVSTLLAKAKALYLYGDFEGAIRFYDNVLLFSPNNAEAKAQKLKINRILANPIEYDHEVTRTAMLNQTTRSWDFGRAYSVEEKASEKAAGEDPIKLKMDRLIITVSLRNADLQSAIDTLNELSKSYDTTGRGLDIVIAEGVEGIQDLPPINLSIQSQPLSKVLDLILRRANYAYDIRDGIIEVHPAVGNTNQLEVEIPSTNAFEKMRKSVNRSAALASSADAVDSSDPWGGGGASAAPEIDDADVPRLYLQKRGVKFSPEDSITCDENTFTVVHSDPKVIEKVRRIIQKLDEDSIKQVNVEAKFIEVVDTVLHEVTANWRLVKNGTVRAATNNRGAHEAHAVDSGTKKGQILNVPEPIYDDDGNVTGWTDTAPVTEPMFSFENPVPEVRGSLNYGPAGIGNPAGVFGTAAPSFVGKIGTLDDYDVHLLLNLLDNKSGADVMAAPSLTVENEATAEIEIAQLINFPSSYDEPQMQVSGGNNWNNNNNNNGGSSSGSLTLTPAVPSFDRTSSEEFEKVGIILTVTPTVNADNSIKLNIEDLKITEFEGFMDYGGTAVSMVGSTIVTTPMTYYQPVFNIRRVKTEVTIADGATMVIGGLMREEVRTVDDKVPILGDLPLIGSAFRGTSKAVQKKNLLVFITGNLISRGGSTAISTFKGTTPAEIYSNPTFMSAAGPLYRESSRPMEESSSSPSSEATTPSSAASL